jgi:hypothetical protein
LGVGPLESVVPLADLKPSREKLELRVALEPWPESLDRRWTAGGAREFLAAARQFARETSFAEFFAKHRPLYEVAESRMRSLLKEEGHLEWFDGFFGERPGAGFVVALGMLNAGHSYGPRVRTADGKEELYCVLGVWKVDAEGQPAFDRTMLATVVHEFCHSYANPIVDRHEADLKAAGEKVFARVAPAMKRQAYGNWRTMLYESLVRACVVRYTRRHLGEAVAREAIADERRRGFSWVGPLSDLLGQYEAQRDRYPTLEAFAPRIVTFFDELAWKLAGGSGRWIGDPIELGAGPPEQPEAGARLTLFFPRDTIDS